MSTSGAILSINRCSPLVVQLCCCFYTTRRLYGKRVENHAPVGLLRNIGRSESAVWAEVKRLGLGTQQLNPNSARIRFSDAAEHYKAHGLEVDYEKHRVRADNTLTEKPGKDFPMVQKKVSKMSRSILRRQVSRLLDRRVPDNSLNIGNWCRPRT